MTYQTFWPATLPRQAPEFTSDTYFAMSPIDAGIVGGGSWSDGSDSTYVSLFNDVTEGGGTEYGSPVAVDFDPVPSINTNDGRFISLGLTCRLQGEAVSQGSGSWALYDGAGTRFSQGFFIDFIGDTPLPITSPTTLTSAPDESTVAVYDASVNALLTDGFTLVAAPTDWTDYAAGPFETWRIFEWGLIFDVTGTPPPSAPRPYRARQRLYPIAPARRWPREAWSGGSARRVGGYR